MHEISLSARNYVQQRVVERDGCWEWARALTKDDYGSCGFEGLSLAHQVAWLGFKGPLPQRRIGRSCGNRSCCNPEHLFEHQLGEGAVTLTVEMLLSRTAPDPNTGCWLWASRWTDKNGYGKAHHGGAIWRAHRLMWTLAIGEIPDGLGVLHKCDTPACIALEHLFLGTNIDNVRDRHAKRRDAFGDRNGSRLHRDRRPRGSANAKAKLTEDQVSELRAAYASGSYQAELARRFSISPSAVHAILVGWNWGHHA